MNWIKNNLKLVIPVAIGLIIGAWIFWPAKKNEAPVANVPNTKVEQINVLPIKERPFVTMATRADGNEINLTVDRVENADQMEYELEYYDAERTYIEGAFGTVNLANESLPVTKQILLGTCSRNVCRYHENVSGGSLTLRFEGGEETYILKTDFNLQLQGNKEGVFGSKDAKVTLNVGPTGLPLSTYVMVASTMGLPDDITEEVVAGPYAFLAATSPALRSATVTFQSSTDLTGTKILYWDGSEWEELDAEIEGNSISAPATALGTFALVK